MLHILNAKILADERERDIRRGLREHALRREAETVAADGTTQAAVAAPRTAAGDRLCPDCPCRLAAPAR